MSRIFPGWRAKPTQFGSPTRVETLSHVTLNPRSSTGFDGLPEEFHEALVNSEIGKDEVLKDPNSVKTALEYVVGGQTPLPRASRHMKHIQAAVQLRQHIPTEIYDMGRQLGFGGCGVVFKAVHNESGRAVAVKIMSSEYYQEIESEIAMHSMSKHANIVEYLEAFDYQDEIWMVLELMDGGSVASVLEKLTVLGGKEIAYVCREALNGLAFLHGQHRLHRDIKCDSILVDSRGYVKITDFGFAVGLTQEQSQRNSRFGTDYWMAPELIQGRDYGDKIDSWSLGISAIEMAHGEPPHYQRSQLQVCHWILSSPPPKLANPEQWSPSFADFLGCSLVHEPEDRASCSDLLLHRFMQNACSRDDFAEFLKRTN